MPFIRHFFATLYKSARKIGERGVFSKKFRRKFKKWNKTLKNDPIFYFGVFSIIFLFGILFSFPETTIKFPAKWDFSFLTNNNLIKASVQDMFIEPAGNMTKETQEMVFLQQNTAIGLIPPAIGSSQVLGSLIGGNGAEAEEKRSIIEYSVETGDTLSSIAEKFNISLNTILWANDLSKGSDIKVGQKLIILPVSGIIYYVKKGDTLSEIAAKYKGKVDEIIAFNELSGENDLYVGDILVIPNGQMPSSAKPTYTATAVSQIPLASNYFICPHIDCRITQGLHWYNAIDFGGQCGDFIVAVAGGIVQKVKFGWNNGGGNTITILHPNGVITSYGHIMTSLVSPGQQVLQGQIIALMGGKPGMPGSGLSTGCHVHFGVIGARNPFAK